MPELPKRQRPLPPHTIRVRGLADHINGQRTVSHPYGFKLWRFARDKKLNTAGLMKLFGKSREVIDYWEELDAIDPTGRPLV